MQPAAPVQFGVQPAAPVRRRRPGSRLRRSSAEGRSHRVRVARRSPCLQGEFGLVLVVIFGRVVKVATACFRSPGFDPDRGFARHTATTSPRSGRAADGCQRTVCQRADLAGGRSAPAARGRCWFLLCARAPGYARVAVNLRTSYWRPEDAGVHRDNGNISDNNCQPIIMLWISYP